jgi:hypothetical protein
MRRCLAIVIVLCYATAGVGVRSFGQPATTQATKPVTQVDHPPSGWRLRLPEGWQVPKPYERAEVVAHWDRKGMTHRIPPDIDPLKPIIPLLLCWGREPVAQQTLDFLARNLPSHQFMAERVDIGPVMELEVSGKRADRVEVRFTRVVAFAPPGQTSAEMRAVLYAVRGPQQENFIWFECPSGDFDKYEDAVDDAVRRAEIVPRQSRAMNED